ncbi:MAG: T9SS type A sorting domain-containing protein [Bacteroidota bacterium]
MKRILWICLALCCLIFPAEAQVTFSEHIAPIIYNNCTSCHRPGEIGPFSLTNYTEVAAWGAMIKYTTEIKYMPPWKPDRTYSSFVGETGLTDTEIQLIADWVDAGKPQGDPTLEPDLPEFPSGSQLGTPDLVLEMAEDYFIEGNNQDDYRVFVLPTGLTEDKEIAAVEFRPGNSRAVHHALLAYETHGAAAAMDSATAEYGYEAFGNFGVTTQGSFTGYTPGIQTVMLPKGIGTTLPAGADLLIQVHYAPLATDETDRSSLNIFFKDEDDPITREVDRIPILPIHLDGGFGSFVIPPDSVADFHGTRTVFQDISLISVYPHMHYLGKNWEIYAVPPAGDTINIIRIDEWDFNWQGAYTFRRMQKIPAGSVMHVNATYDNTTANPFNPSNPPQTVSWGEGTTDEMYLVGTAFVPYQPGDEDIVIGNEMTTSLDQGLSAAGDRLYLPYPNPGQDDVILSFSLTRTQAVSIDLFDIRGKLVRSIRQEETFSTGLHKINFDARELPPGRYTLRMHNTDLAVTQTMLISK